jgi:hypothetical protein
MAVPGEPCVLSGGGVYPRSAQSTDTRFGGFLEDPQQGLGRAPRPPASLLLVLERTLADPGHPREPSRKKPKKDAEDS